MTTLRCRDYGFDCKFEVTDDNSDLLIKKFGEHTFKKHGIEYSKEALMQIVLRKRQE